MSTALGEGQPFTDQGSVNGSQVGTYSLPQIGRFVVDSVYVTIDASGSGDVTPELTMLNPAGVVIATKTQAQAVTGGAPGSATWARRLADDTGATPGATGDYVFIDQQTRNVSNEIVFAAIPATFRHLRLELSLTRTAASVATALIKWNGASVWSSAFIFMNAPNGALSRCSEMVDGDGVYLNFGHVNGAVGTSRPYELFTDGSGDTAEYVMEMPWYARAGTYHKIVWQGVCGRFAGLTYTTGVGTDETGSTLAPIDTLTIMCQTGVLGADSIATLYGIK